MNDTAQADQNLRLHGGVLLNVAPPAATWESLLESESSISDAADRIIQSCETNGRRLAGAELEATDAAIDMLKAIRQEKAARDSVGNRAPRSRTGRLTEASPISDHGAQPGGGYSGPSLGVPRSARMQDVFGSTLRTGNSGFKSLAEFTRTIFANPSDGRLIQNAADGMTESIGETGGFMIPPQFATEMFDQALESEVVRPQATIYPVETNQLVVGQVDLGGDHSTGNIGGLTTQWSDEAQDLTLQKARVTPWTCRINKAVIYVPLSNELLEDGISTDRWLSGIMTGSLSYGLDTAFLSGSGTGRPLGILASPSLIVQAKESSQSTATIIAANLLGMMARLHPAFEKNSVWIVSPSARAFLYTTSQEQGVDMPGVNRTVTSVGTNLFIMGRPVIVSEKLPAIGTQGDIILADLSQYIIALRHGLRLERSFDQLFGSDQVAYRLKLRAGGQGRWTKVFTPAGGGPTLSWAVTLAVRP